MSENIVGSRSMYNVLMPSSGSPFALRVSPWTIWHLKYSEKYEGALGFSAGIPKMGRKNMFEEITEHSFQIKYLHVKERGSYNSMAQYSNEYNQLDGLQRHIRRVQTPIHIVPCTPQYKNTGSNLIRQTEIINYIPSELILAPLNLNSLLPI